jgi:hypothetical protein
MSVVCSPSGAASAQSVLGSRAIDEDLSHRLSSGRDEISLASPEASVVTGYLGKRLVD